jgi:hypothetical protein
MNRLTEFVALVVAIVGLAWGLPRWFAWRESLWRAG